MGPAKIRALTLEQMVETADAGVYGEIVARHAFRVDHPIDGPELYFTLLTLEGRTLGDRRRITVDLLYPGGWVSETEGVWNSESPTDEETAVGRRVVAFYKWVENLGGDVSGNALVAAQGGLFRTVDGPEGSLVLGRGEGYALARNTALGDLDRRIEELRAAPLPPEER